MSRHFRINSHNGIVNHNGPCKTVAVISGLSGKELKVSVHSLVNFVKAREADIIERFVTGTADELDNFFYQDLKVVSQTVQYDINGNLVRGI
mgnify:CR=1 FL=1